MTVSKWLMANGKWHCEAKQSKAIYNGLKIASLTLAMTIVIASSLSLLAMTAVSAFALEMPDEVRGYYKDRVSSAPGYSDGVAPTVEKAKVIEGVDIGRRESQEFDFSDESSSALAVKSWEALNKKDEQALLAYTSRCIELYQEEARDQQTKLSDFAPAGSEEIYESLNNIAVCYFMLAELYKYKKDWEKSRENYKKAADKFYFSQYWDPRGWWWKPGKISAEEVKKIDEGYYEKD